MSRQKCPRCGKDVNVRSDNRFEQHGDGASYRAATCPMTFQRVPITGVTEWDDEQRARLIADLAWQVQDSDPFVVWEYLTCLGASELQRLLMFSLAAVPVERRVEDMWSWVNRLPVAQVAS